ncbi:PREDICTED: mucin-17-like [Camelina sativa]|uniref:Mucin-17-like n=1 Tax=Camelina sativa TaxID=90675 RepID=A0ABM0VW59_CAMSA|nr:PREDICTED: mucin-17-like [Camelina sativa]
MDKDEPFVYNEVDYKTPKQSPRTWPMDKIRQGRFQHKMSSLLSPATPKRNYNISNTKSLLLHCLRDAKSDPLPRRRFPVSCSDEGVLMDGVLVTSATKKKVLESPSISLGGTSLSSISRSQHKKDTEFSSPISDSGSNQETTLSQQPSSAGKGKMLAYSPCTPKAAKPSKLQASAEPFILTPRQATPFPLQQHPFNPQFPRANPLHLQPYPYFHRPRPLIYLYQRPPPLLPLLPHGSDPYKLTSEKDFPPILFASQTPTRRNRRIDSFPTTPSSSQPNNTTSDPVPVQTPISTTATANLGSSTTTAAHGSSPSVDGLDTVTQIPDLSSSPSDGIETVTQIPDLSSSPSDGIETVTQNPALSPPSDGLETVTQILDLSSSPSDGLDTMAQIPDLSSSPSDGIETETQKPVLSPPSDGLEAVTPKPDLSSPSVGVETVTPKPDLPSTSAGLLTMKINKEWSPSDDGLPTFTQAQLDFMKSHHRLFPDYVFGGYKYKQRMPSFKHQEEHQ